MITENDDYDCEITLYNKQHINTNNKNNNIKKLI